LVASIAAVFAGCSSGSSGVDEPVEGPVTASFTPSEAAPAPDLVRLRGSADADMVTLDVVIGGETTSDSIFAFAFDLLLSQDDVADFVEGSEELGSALIDGPGQFGVAQVIQMGNRITVGVTKLGGSGNSVGPGEETIVSLRFRVTRRAATTIGIDLASDPAALDDAPGDEQAVIPSVQFDGGLALIQGS
jgi:hypothetical protein